MQRLVITGILTSVVWWIYIMATSNFGLPVEIALLVGIVQFLLIFVMLPDKFNLRRRGKK